MCIHDIINIGLIALIVDDNTDNVVIRACKKRVFLGMSYDYTSPHLDHDRFVYKKIMYTCM